MAEPGCRVGMLILRGQNKTHTLHSGTCRDCALGSCPIYYRVKAHPLATCTHHSALTTHSAVTATVLALRHRLQIAHPSSGFMVMFKLWCCTNLGATCPLVGIRNPWLQSAKGSKPVTSLVGSGDTPLSVWLVSSDDHLCRPCQPQHRYPLRAIILLLSLVLTHPMVQVDLWLKPQ